MNQEVLRNVTLVYGALVGVFAIVVAAQVVRLFWRKAKRAAARTADHMGGDHFIINR